LAYLSVSKRLCDEKVSFKCENDSRGKRIEISESQQNRSNPISLNSASRENVDVVQVKLGPINVPSVKLIKIDDHFEYKFNQTKQLFCSGVASNSTLS
jgi:hypothetical protein